MPAETFLTKEGIQVPAVTAAEMREVDRVAVEEFGLDLLQIMETGNLEGGTKIKTSLRIRRYAMEKINLEDKFDLIDEYWSPGVIGEVNNMEVKLAKVKGEFKRHHHEDKDELFFVVSGELKIEFPEKVELLEEGELIVVPHGVEHKPVAEKEAKIMLVEPRDTKNTGNIDSEMTVKDPDRI